MTFASNLPDDLVRAYRETDYVVGRDGWILRIDEPSIELEAQHRRHGVTHSAFITAWNPFSQALSAAENAQRHAALLAELTRDGRAWFEGVGIHPSNAWPGEESVLILGLDLESAKAMGSRLQQNAIVWSGPDAVPRLILLR